MSAELHRDCCPKCGSALQHIRVKEGEADQCPSCLGVWLGYDMFAALTHPAGGYLQDIFRTLVLEYSMGEIPGPEKKEDEAADA